MSADEQPMPEMGLPADGRWARDEEWQREMGALLHQIELVEHVGTSGDDVQVLLQYVWDPGEVDLAAPPVESVGGKVTPASIAALTRWHDQAHPVWKLVVMEDAYDEAAQGVTGNPVVVVQITERRLEDLARRLWLHPWYRKLLGIDWVPDPAPEVEAKFPGTTARLAAAQRQMRRQRRRVEADLADSAAREWKGAGR